MFYFICVNGLALLRFESGKPTYIGYHQNVFLNDSDFWPENTIIHQLFRFGIELLNMEG